MATNFEPQSKLLRSLVLSEKRQSSWGAAAVLAPAALTRVQRFDGSAVIDRSPARRSDAAMSGKGTHFATNGQITMWDLKISGVKCELSDWLAGWVLSFVFGKDTVTGSAAPYTHTMAFDESTRQAIPTTVYLKDSDDLSYYVPDLSVSTCTLTVSTSGSIQVEFDFIGTGYLIPGVMAPLPPVPDETYILGSDTDYQIGNVGAPVSILGRHSTSTLKLDWQTTVHRATGTGLYGAFNRKGAPKFSLSSTISAKDQDDIYTRMINNTPTAIKLVANSGPAAQLTISIPKCNLKTTKMGFDDDEAIWSVEVDETTCYQQAGVAPIVCTVVNSTAAYLLT